MTATIGGGGGGRVVVTVAVAVTGVVPSSAVSVNVPVPIVLERQMAGWIDEPIPALGALTPRQAAASPKARPKLATLLKEFVQHEARLPEEERIDLGGLRSALGFSDL